MISSDCGATFVAADAELRALFTVASSGSEHIRTVLANDRVEWKFNPPSAPHFEGLWETFEEISTLLTQIESCLNSRPLRALTDDPDDLDALTPGHLLIGLHFRRSQNLT